jgi:hypothetical protein
VPLFTHQLSHLWIDFRGIKDTFMAGKGIDYFENSRRATYVQQQYAVDNPLKFASYGRNCWGITASDGPGPDEIKINGIERQFFGVLSASLPDLIFRPGYVEPRPARAARRVVGR